jgi:hypothetical protein
VAAGRRCWSLQGAVYGVGHGVWRVRRRMRVEGGTVWVVRVVVGRQAMPLDAAELWRRRPATRVMRKLAHLRSALQLPPASVYPSEIRLACGRLWAMFCGALQTDSCCWMTPAVRSELSLDLAPTKAFCPEQPRTIHVQHAGHIFQYSD